jgi:thymidylate kinase
MIVEFVGSSGAGKSSLVERLLGSVPQGSALVDAWDLVARPGRRWTTHPTVRNLVADAVVLPTFTSIVRRDPAFARFASERLRHHPSTFARWNYLLNVERRVGMQALTRRRARGRIVLADEGALLLAYQLFVYTAAPFERADVERFVELVPLPDRVVYVRAPLETLVERSIGRTDRRRELAGDDRAEVERWALRSVELFDMLTASPAISNRLLVVDNPGGQADLQTAAERVLAFLRAPATDRAPLPSHDARS